MIALVRLAPKGRRGNNAFGKRSHAKASQQSARAAKEPWLLVAQKTIPMGTAYAVWTGIGAVGTFALGLLLFSEPATLARFFFVGLIVAGIIGLKLASAH